MVIGWAHPTPRPSRNATAAREYGAAHKGRSVNAAAATNMAETSIVGSFNLFTSSGSMPRITNAATNTVPSIVPIAEAVLLLQRCFWTTVTADPAKTAQESMPDHLFERGLIQLAICLVFLGIAQVVFTRLENKFPERL